MFNKKILFLSSQLFLVLSVFAQAVPKTTLVEHFTNTRCGVCASRNPAFYTNLGNQTNTLHIAFHPSAPYTSCVFSQENVDENDARTNFYGIYGGTPRLVINGTVIPVGQNYGLAALFTPYQGLTSPFSLAVAISPKGADSVTAAVTVTTRAAHNYTNLNIYLALLEDTVFYAAPNGEQRHYDVMRRSFTGNGNLAFAPAAAVGGSVTITKTVYKKSNWLTRRLYAIANVQTATNESLQAAASPRLSSVVATQSTAQAAPIKVFPNPANEVLFLENTNEAAIKSLFLYNTLGQAQALVWQSGNTNISIEHLPKGVYILQFLLADGSSTSVRFVKGV